MAFRVLRFLVGLALLPVCVAVSMTLYALVRGVSVSTAGGVPPGAWAFLAGMLLWLLAYASLPKSTRLYVLGHELTHALWAWLMGIRVMDMKVGSDKGSVTLAESNFLITLAPYFFPIYTMLVIAAYGITALFAEIDAYYLWWLAAVGFTWGFHLTFTVSSLMQHQSDVRECGHLFSYAVIYLFNVAGICLWVVAVSSAGLEDMVGHFVADCVSVVRTLWHWVTAAWHVLRPQ